MNKTPRIIFASVGFLAAALLVDASNAGQVVAQTVKAQLVQVVNTSSQPIPVNGKVGIDPTQNTVKVDTNSPLPVAGTVGLASNASIGINAAQNTVKVDTSNPLNVRDASDAVVPWHGRYDIILPTNNGNVTQHIPLTLPDGKRLVIEQISVRANLQKSDDGKGAIAASGTLSTVSNGTGGDTQIQFMPAMEYWNSRTFTANQEVHAYADSGTSLHFFFERDNFKGDALFRVAITGHLIDTQ